MKEQQPLPELLVPAGSYDALLAAIESGADAIYLGAPTFNARMRAQNFTEEELARGVSLAHAYGIRVYLTLNTLCTSREMPDFLAAAENAARLGVDALIVADLGGAAAIHRAMPQLALHASTQASGHNIAAARQLAAIGFSRMVIARETPSADIRAFAARSGMEIEVFVHGALCVSHSGQCLFSSLVGGRSGNRGECAQPCRLPDANGRYPLSLKDLSLARHVPELIDMGVHSLKIEGRLKSPAYVRDVTAIWRKLLDERRGATKEEMGALAATFSRGGFTDGYFTSHIGEKMLGVRTEKDKQESQKTTPFAGLTRKIPLALSFVMQENKPMRLTLTASGKTVTVTGITPERARNTPMDDALVKKNLCRFGGTPFEVTDAHITLDTGLMVPVSALNALRRAAVEALLPPAGIPLAQQTERLPPTAPYVPARAMGERVCVPTARFETAAQITPAAKAYFAHCYLPLHAYDPVADGVVLPPVIFDSERETIAAELEKAAKRGAKHALVGNLGHLTLATDAELIPHGDFRLNIYNEETLSFLLSRGFADALLSPELTLPQIRDFHGACDVIVYGRVPLMLLEKCAGKEVGSCAACEKGANALVDRRGEVFPLLRLPPHRNILYNSRPTAMSDRKEQLRRAGIVGGHYLFSVETPREIDTVLRHYGEGTPIEGAIRRI